MDKLYIHSTTGEALAGNAQQQLSGISFSTLAKAQDKLSKKRKRGSDSNEHHEDKLEALRARLRELKESKNGTSKITKSTSSKQSQAESRKVGAQAPTNSRTRPEEEDDSDMEEDEDLSDQADATSAPHARSSKHAPTSISSRKQVTRKRTVIPTAKSTTRDPRFAPVGGPPTTDAQLSQRYSFLRTYRDDEIATLRTLLKSPAGSKIPAEEKADLRQQLMAMENRKRAQDAKERTQKVVREHRKAEQARVGEGGGKKPFFLKRGEIQKRAEEERLKGMKAKEREKTVEKRRKKESQREKRSMPAARRVRG